MKPNPCRTPSLDELGTTLEMGIQDLDLPACSGAMKVIACMEDE
jgi:hypothetical protein